MLVNDNPLFDMLEEGDEILKEHKIRMTVVLTEYDKMKLERYASWRNESISSIIRGWIDHYCK